ncbi:MAG: GDP-mannose 4,6-dehydratase [archaeon]
MKKALITGITGQDGSYLAEFLLSKGYEVHGIVRRSSSFNRERLKEIYDDVKLRKNLHIHYGDMTDSSSLAKIIPKVNPDEIYNLAAQSHVQVSFEIPEYTSNCDAIGVLRILELLRELNMKKTKFYQASTSELFGKAQEYPQNEETPFNPVSPYAIAKLYGFWMVKHYRETYGIFACNGILFNHESERRGDRFVTKKITKAVAAIKLGLKEKISLGNLNAKRDWGYAKDYVKAMWMMMQNNKPEDFIIATGESHSVREFTEEAFKNIGIEIQWKGHGIKEKGVEKKTGKILVDINPAFFRPAEVEMLIGDPKKAKEKLGWTPTMKFNELVKLMIEYDLEELKKRYIDYEEKHKFLYINY